MDEVDPKIVKLLVAGKKIEAITVYREQTGVSLKEAKDYVKSLYLQEGQPVMRKHTYVRCICTLLLILGVFIAGQQDQSAVRRTFDNLRDHDPYFSPDGKQVAWLTQTAGMLTAPPAGSWSIRIADTDQQDWGKEGTFRWIINDKNINSYPAWSPDGTRIAFHRLVLGKSRGFGVFTIKPDDSDLRELPKGAQEVCEYPSFSSGSTK